MMNLSDFSKQDWKRATAAGAIIGGLIVGALSWTLSVTAPLPAALLEQHGLDDRAEVLTAPLKPWQLNGKELPWYGLDLDALPDQNIDLLIVDGPPGYSDPVARYPAVPVLRQHLSDECVIVLDDGDRAGECETAHRWAEEMDSKLEYAGGKKGTWILRRNNA